MKNLKKLIAALVVISMIATFIVPAFADEFKYEKEARDLYDLGLYKGTDPNSYVPNLEGKLDRQTGVIMLLRLFGQEEDALELTFEDAKAKLANFSDAADIADWAQKQVAYAVNKGYVKGYPDGTFKPSADLNGKAYSSLILQQLGYDGDFDYNSAALFLKEKGGLTDEQAALFNSDAGLNRDSLVGISHGAMFAVYKGSDQTVAEKLVELGKIDKTLALDKGYVFKKVKEVASLEDVRVAIGGTPSFPEKVKVTYEDDTTEELTVSWPTNIDTSAAGEKEIEGKILKTKDSVAKVKLIVEEDVLKPLKIVNTNLKEIIVEFNKALDEKSAEAKGNYELDEEALDKDDKIELNDDGKSVTITFAKALDNHSDIELLIKNVKDASGKVMEDEVTLKAKISDTTFPEVKDIVLTGPDTFKIIFSEPIDASQGGSIDFDDGVYTVTFDNKSAGNELICSLGTDDIDEGDYEVVVEDFKDFAGYMIADKTFTLKYAVDKSPITAEIKEAKQEKVVIKFNKGVKNEDGEPLTREFFYQTLSKYMPDEVDGVEYNADFTEYTLHFTENPLNEGSVKVVVKNKADVDGDTLKVEDVWGNELKSDIILTASVSADKTKPTITSIDTDDDESQVKIYFSEAVNEEDAEDEDNYIFKNSKGEEVTPESIEYKEDKDEEEYYVIVYFDEDLSGDYTVEVKDIRDVSLAENIMDTVTRKFNVKDITPIDPNEVEVYGVDGDTRDYLFVYYPEDMDTKSILDKDNYLIISSEGIKELADKDKVELFNGKKSKVKITLHDPDKYDVESGEIALQIGKVKDAAGNAVKSLSFYVDVEADKAPTVTEAKKIDSNKIELKLDKVITSVDVKGITVVAQVYDKGTTKEVKAQPAKYSTVVKDSDNETIVTLTLKSEQKIDDPALQDIKIDFDEGAFKSETNKEIEETKGVAVADGWGPGLDEVDSKAKSGYFDITFDEAIVDDDSALSLFATELKLVDKDGKRLKANKHFTLDQVDDNVIRVTLIGDDYEDYSGKLKVSLESDSDYAKDAAGNGVRKFDAKTVTF